jgi:hypothetical protein
MSGRMSMLVMSLVFATFSATAIAHGQAAPADNASGRDRLPGGLINPLAAQPLEAMSATRDRPLFSPTRRPPPPPPQIVAAPPPPPPPPEPPSVLLVGVVMDGEEATSRDGRSRRSRGASWFCRSTAGLRRSRCSAATVRRRRSLRRSRDRATTKAPLRRTTSCKIRRSAAKRNHSSHKHHVHRDRGDTGASGNKFFSTRRHQFNDARLQNSFRLRRT